MKKIIYIGGTSYSGSTFFDMILANDQHGFSCGEVYKLFKPYDPSHVDPECGCGEKSCSIWNKALENGEKQLYHTIFNMFPEIYFITDSSKNPFWIDSQIKLLRENGIEFKNILIWKTPLEAALSFNKRNRLKNWEATWINYHRLYFTLVTGWKTVRYHDLTKDKNVLKKVCEYLQIPYFEGKEKFWEKTNHTLFGNTSARIHLFSKDSKNFDRAKKILTHSSQKEESRIKQNYHNIYYDKVDDAHLEKIVNKRMSKEKFFTDILEILNKNDISREGNDFEDIEKLKITWIPTQLRKMKRFWNYKKLGFVKG